MDGSGYPDGLAGTGIPLAARIITVAADFDDLQNGTLVPTRIARDEAVKLIVKGSGKRYCPEVVAAFERVIHGGDARADEKMVAASDLKVGMVLARDLLNSDGVLLLACGQVLTPRYVAELPAYLNSDGSELKPWIRIQPPQESKA